MPQKPNYSLCYEKKIQKLLDILFELKQNFFKLNWIRKTKINFGKNKLWPPKSKDANLIDMNNLNILFLQLEKEM